MATHKSYQYFTSKLTENLRLFRCWNTRKTRLQWSFRVEMMHRRAFDFSACLWLEIVLKNLPRAK